jgi:hypothetical protein
MDRYTYVPLQRPSSIRLLHILPEPQETLRIKLISTPLALAPRYLYAVLFLGRSKARPHIILQWDAIDGSCEL